MSEATEITPTFSGEVQLAGWSESHTSGCKVTFWLSDPSDLEAFRQLTVRKGNTAGHRLACVLVEIGEDEQPVQPQRKDQRGPLCREACDYCAMPEFQRWAAGHGFEANEDGAKDLIKHECGVDSRKQLDTDVMAGASFVREIRIPFMRWQRERMAA